ncbi:MAG: hypothetical protein K2N48_01125 [Muribaculaceae bacterium]|nr:hypothetical protein [Muribaculaceae bacterium]
MKTKECAQCGQEKPIEDFSKSYKNICKACVAENKRLKYQIDRHRDFKKSLPNRREQIAISAMHGLIASGHYTTNSTEFIAEKAISYAEALLDKLNATKDGHNQ